MINQYFNKDCISGSKEHFEDASIDLLIMDPPFGIDESTFQKHYYRDNLVIDGYVSAPDDYDNFSYEWISECKRILKENGSLYIVSGWSNLHHILNAVHALKLNLVNHIIWKFNFGVYTKRKYVTSHYHILYITKSEKSKPIFNTYCRFGFSEKTNDDRSLQYQDVEDVWYIPKEYQSGEFKNINKLPEELVRKIIQYSSNPGDLVCDFFLGNFTTAFVAKKMGRYSCGFELNKQAYDYFVPKLKDVEFACDLINQKIVDSGIPENQGKKLTDEEILAIQNDFQLLTKTITKKQALKELTAKFGRGRWSLERIIKKELSNGNDESGQESNNVSG